MNTTAAIRPKDASWKQEDMTPMMDMERVNILIVDDLPEKLLVYRSILEELDQNLITVQSGEEALKLVLKHEFAVILLDVNMPGMDGFETAALIRKRKKSARTPIIFLTAFTDEVRAAQGYASGAVDYLPTPVVPEVLQAKVRVFIELSQMRRQAALQAEERARRTAAEESASRWEFLVKASEVLALLQTQSEVLSALVRLPVPYLADLSFIWFANPEGGNDCIECAWHDRNGNIHSDLFPSIQDLFPWLQKPIHQVIKTGQLQWLQELPPPVTLSAEQRAAFNGHASIIYSLPILESALVLPLAVRGQTRGVLVLARKRSDSSYQRLNISLASELARRSGLALENIMLVEKIKEADRRKDEFLGMLAHELRNPLGPIRNAMYLLQLLGPKEPHMEQIRDIIDRQVTHMARLIDDLLDATRLAHGKILLRKERCDLTKLVSQTAEDYLNIFDASGLQLNIEVPDKPIWVDGDPTRLVQAIGNLLHNAHKFTNPGGQVTVTLTYDKRSSTAAIKVTDTGIGIHIKMLPCIFDVFQQAEQGLDRSRGGLGLGLALVKGLVSLHEGEVYAASEGLGKGASFTIRLPLHSLSAIEEASAAIAAIPEGEKYRVLVIEDNRDTAESARLLLSLEGYEVRTAHSGLEGLEEARHFQPQVVLCDIGLPGMDGYQVVRSIRQDTALSSAYVIALTGYGRDEDQRQAQEAGFDLHLTKPIDYNNLRRALAHVPQRT